MSALRRSNSVRREGRVRGSNFESRQVGDVDPVVFQAIPGRVGRAEADEADVEARAVEARDHPGEQAFDPVHPRAGPTQVVTNLHDVEGPRV